jgi:hypothetical protein
MERQLPIICHKEAGPGKPDRWSANGAHGAAVTQAGQETHNLVCGVHVL